MKTVLIVGKNSYIGTSIAAWFEERGYEYLIEKISVRDNGWKDIDFSPYDIIIYLAGMVHVKEKKENWSQYVRLNSELPFEVALKARKEGVKHFIFLSTKGVYKPNTPLISRDTVPMPVKLYGKSKLQGENRLIPLNSDTFRVSVLRPAVVYGEGCKGNFPRLETLSEKIHIFPNNDCKRSMIYIWNLCEYIHLLIESEGEGEIIRFPQDRDPISTKDIMIRFWEERKEKYYISNFLNLFVKIALWLPGLAVIKTMFMNTVYAPCISNDFENRYCVYSFSEAMHRVAAKR